jgi:hypothetical protein
MQHDSTLNGIVKQLSSKQEAAALCLAKGCTIPVASRESKCGARTIKTWLATVPDFKQRVNQLRSEMTARALGRLIRQMTSAASTLGYLSRKASSEMVRLLAASKVIELGIKVREHGELAERMTALEEAHAQRPTPRGRIA